MLEVVSLGGLGEFEIGVTGGMNVKAGGDVDELLTRWHTTGLRTHAFCPELEQPVHFGGLFYLLVRCH